MTKERYQFLMANVDESLTNEEIEQGWHFCMEFDGLLVKGDPKEIVCGKACIDWNGGS